MMASGEVITQDKPQDTLIILMKYKNARYIKHAKIFLRKRPRYHVACAGSLGIALSKPASFPVGKVDFRNYANDIYRIFIS